MMTPLFVIYAGLAIIWWLFAWLYYDYRVDLLRSRLFLARDRLFDFAGSGKIDVKDPAYLLTMRMINGSLRFAHRLTLVDLLIMSWVQKKYNPKGVELHHARINSALHGLNFEQKKRIVDIHLEMQMNIISHVAHVSLLLVPFVYLAKLAFRLHFLRKYSSIAKKTRSRLNPIDAVIYDQGNKEGFC